MHTSPPAGFSPDLVSYYLAYHGDLSAANATLECVEIVNRVNSVTVAPTQAIVGLEVAAGIGSSADMGALTFPALTGIIADVNLPSAGSGTVTTARAIQVHLPTSVAGNTITTAIGIEVVIGTLAGGTVDTAIGEKITMPTSGTVNYGLYILGDVNGSTPLEVRGGDGATGLIARFRRNNATDSHLIIGALGDAYSVIATSLDMVLSTDQAGQDLGTIRVTIKKTTGYVGIADPAPGEMLDVTGNIDCTGVYKVDDVQVIGPRVIDARASAVANSGDATTDGLIDALRDAMIAHGLIAAA
jgi:hypothetical protein